MSRFGIRLGMLALLATCVSVAFGLAAPPTAGADGVTADEKSRPFANPQAQIEALKATPVESELKGTYSTKHLFDTYSAGIQHVQGIAELSDGRYALSHNSRTDRKALMAVSTGDDDCKMFTMGAADHPGGIEACGKVIVVPIKGDAIKGSQIMFVDARNKTSPNIATLAHLTYQDENLGSLNAAGIVYDEAAKHHWILTTTNPDFGYGNTATLYKTTENMSLFDPRNKLKFVTTISHLLTSQGGTQLLLDTEGKLYVAALYRDNDGKEHVALSSLESPESNRNAKLLVDKTLSDSGSDIDFSAGFRWGGTIATGPGLSADGKIVSRLEVVGVSRLLTYGPAQQYAKLRIWRQ